MRESAWESRACPERSRRVVADINNGHLEQFRWPFPFEGKFPICHPERSEGPAFSSLARTLGFVGGRSLRRFRQRELHIRREAECDEVIGGVEVILAALVHDAHESCFAADSSGMVA